MLIAYMVKLETSGLLDKATQASGASYAQQRLASMSNLALVVNSQGKYNKAKEMKQPTLELRETVLGKEHPDTLESMNNLAGVLDRQGKLNELHSSKLDILMLKAFNLHKQRLQKD
jgi:hypothetical protein